MILTEETEVLSLLLVSVLLIQKTEVLNVTAGGVYLTANS
jgi:hypothetical protein